MLPGSDRGQLPQRPGSGLKEFGDRVVVALVLADQCHRSSLIRAVSSDLFSGAGLRAFDLLTQLRDLPVAADFNSRDRLRCVHEFLCGVRDHLLPLA
ncbi:hypothetical protein [Nocardia xishanensis]|uniref:Uncharacterized protein n=1 Tax=Nocardia xishanensis TaxID=238964 RepID=A0ABW7XCA3_9NOCA